jgi:hypothetical protein
VDALRNAGHFGVAVPVELEPVRHQHEEKSKLGLHLDGEGDDSVGLSQLPQYDVELRNSNFAKLLDEESIMLRVAEGLCLEILVLGSNISN